MRSKEINGPAAIAVVVVVVVLAVLGGYYYLNKDQMGDASKAKKLGRPGEIPAGANRNIGPFPGDSPGGKAMYPNGAPGVQAPRPGAPGASGG